MTAACVLLFKRTEQPQTEIIWEKHRSTFF